MTAPVTPPRDEDAAEWLAGRVAVTTRRHVYHPPGVRGLPAYCGCCGCVKRYCLCSCCCGKRAARA